MKKPITDTWYNNLSEEEESIYLIGFHDGYERAKKRFNQLVLLKTNKTEPKNRDYLTIEKIVSYL